MSTLDRWNWGISSQARLATLSATWLLALLPFASPVVMASVLAVRLAASTCQTALNLRLGRRTPIGSPTHIDWLLVAAIFTLAEVASFATRDPMQLQGAWTAALLLPYSALQLRMWRRSRAAHRVATTRHAAVIRLERLERAA